MKSFEEILNDKSPVDKIDAWKAVSELYKSIGLNVPKDFIFLPNLAECVNYAKTNKLVKTSIKKEIINNLNRNQAKQNRHWSRNRTIAEISEFITNRLLIQSDICIIPQINSGGYQTITGLGYMIKLHEKICKIWQAIYDQVPFFIPLKNYCILSESRLQVYVQTTRTEINWNTDTLLHRDGQLPAVHVLGNDNFNMYYKNGVKLSSKWFKVPPEKLSAQEILQVPNVEARMELMRYVGMELLLSNLKHKVIDKTKDGVYELLQVSVNIGRGNDRVPANIANERRIRGVPDTFVEEAFWFYLKMINPSTGVFHIEAVNPSCRTVEQALNWRAAQVGKFLAKNETWEPEQIT